MGARDGVPGDGYPEMGAWIMGARDGPPEMGFPEMGA